MILMTLWKKNLFMLKHSSQEVIFNRNHRRAFIGNFPSIETNCRSSSITSYQIESSHASVVCQTKKLMQTTFTQRSAGYFSSSEYIDHLVRLVELKLTSLYFIGMYGGLSVYITSIFCILKTG